MKLMAHTENSQTAENGVRIFVAYVVKESYEKKGLKAPEDFIKLRDDRINRRVEDMKQWGIDNGKYLHTAGRKKKDSLLLNK